MTRCHTCGLLAVAALAACSNHSGDGAPLTASPTVVATEPANGATDVDPNAEVAIQLAFPYGGSPVGAVTIRDGSNVLPGTFTAAGGGNWRWTPAAGMPRGNQVVVSSQSQGEVAQFTVREAATRRLYERPSLPAEAALAWPGGRSAVRAGGRWFEVTPGGLEERFTDLPVDAVPFGDGLAVYREQGTTWDEHWLVRSGLDGERDRVRMPAAGGAIDVNSRGDVVVFVTANNAPLEDRGFWVLPADGFAWLQVGAYELYLHPSLYQVPTPHIADDGAVSLAYRVQDEGVFVRFAPGQLAAEQVALPGQGVIHHWGAGDDGSGWVVWDEADGADERVLRGMRYTPGEGLAAATELRRWQLTASGTTAVSCRGVRAGGAGSLILDLSVSMPSSPAGPFVRQFLRLERDGWTSLPTPYDTSLVQRRLLTSAARAETWALQLSPEARELTFVRSRPGNQIEIDRSLYAVPEPALGIGNFVAAIDDAGRATVAMNIVSFGSVAQSLRVLVFE
ncbi:MAG: Ig-like domain-containing protein [Planctomycetota bacterium]